MHCGQYVEELKTGKLAESGKCEGIQRWIFRTGICLLSANRYLGKLEIQEDTEGRIVSSLRRNYEDRDYRHHLKNEPF